MFSDQLKENESDWQQSGGAQHLVKSGPKRFVNHSIIHPSPTPC